VASGAEGAAQTGLDGIVRAWPPPTAAGDRPPRGERQVEQGGRVIGVREWALEWASAH
jgi:hypothetical protein